MACLSKEIIVCKRGGVKWYNEIMKNYLKILVLIIILTFFISSPVSAERIFTNKVDYRTGSGPSFVTTGLFNADNYLDLVVPNADENTISILLGNGNGTFQNLI